MSSYKHYQIIGTDYDGKDHEVIITVEDDSSIPPYWACKVLVAIYNCDMETVAVHEQMVEECPICGDIVHKLAHGLYIQQIPSGVTAVKIERHNY